MGTLIGKLKALNVARVKQPGMYGDGGGLWLQVTSAGARSWIFRYWSAEYDPAAGSPIRDEKGKVRGRSREMGLGSFAVVSLQQARELAVEYRKLRVGLRDGKAQATSGTPGGDAMSSSATDVRFLDDSKFWEVILDFSAMRKSFWNLPKSSV
jgi:hypothetical protein